MDASFACKPVPAHKADNECFSILLAAAIGMFSTYKPLWVRGKKLTPKWSTLVTSGNGRRRRLCTAPIEASQRVLQNFVCGVEQGTTHESWLPVYNRALSKRWCVHGLWGTEFLMIWEKVDKSTARVRKRYTRS